MRVADAAVGEAVGRGVDRRAETGDLHVIESVGGAEPQLELAAGFAETERRGSAPR